MSSGLTSRTRVAKMQDPDSQTAAEEVPLTRTYGLVREVGCPVVR
jgi:hypothetical protein